MNLPRWVTPVRRRIPLSGEGFGWLVLTAAMMATGLIKSINLITLFACVLLAAGLVNFVLARRQVVGLRVEREAPDFLLAETPNPWRLRIQQTKRRARHGLYVIDPWPEPLIWFVDLPAAAEQTWTREIVPERRGVLTLGPVVVRSGHPFGFASWERKVSAGATVFVAPRLGQLQRGVLRRWLSRRNPAIGAIRTRPQRHPSGQMEFHGLRSFRAGDSPRLIHWRTSARRGELMVREFEEYPNDDLALIVDLARPAGADPKVFERMLSLAATIVWEWCRQKGDGLTVILAGPTPCRLSGTTGTALRADVMRALAAAQPMEQADGDAVVAALQHTPMTATAHLLLSVGPSALADPLAAALRQALAVVDVAAGDEREFFEMEAPGSPVRPPI
jgi:uncharacterized protein (DUF58 family)